MNANIQAAYKSASAAFAAAMDSATSKNDPELAKAEAAFRAAGVEYDREKARIHAAYYADKSPAAVKARKTLRATRK